MIQLWEVLGRTCVEDGYMEKILGTGGEPILSDRAEHDNAFQQRMANEGGQPHLSRAELTEMYRLLKSRLFLDAAKTLRQIMAASQAVPQWSLELLRAVGLATIDTTFRRDISADVTQANTVYRFALTPQDATALRELVHHPAAPQTFDVLHFHWSPPDCICGLSFSEVYKHPLEGATKDVPSGADGPSHSV